MALVTPFCRSKGRLEHCMRSRSSHSSRPRKCLPSTVLIACSDESNTGSKSKRNGKPTPFRLIQSDASDWPEVLTLLQRRHCLMHYAARRRAFARSSFALSPAQLLEPRSILGFLPIKRGPPAL